MDELKLVLVWNTEVVIQSLDTTWAEQSPAVEFEQALDGLSPLSIQWSPPLNAFIVLGQEEPRLAILNVDGTSETVMRRSDAERWFPRDVLLDARWAPRSERILLYTERQRREGWEWSFWIYTPGTESISKLYSRMNDQNGDFLGVQIGSAIWSSEEHAVVFAAQAPDFQRQLYTIPVTCADACEPSLFTLQNAETQADHNHPALHPNDQLLAFTCAFVRVCLVDSRTGAAVPTGFEVTNAQSAASAALAWSPHGDYLAYMSSDEPGQTAISVIRVSDGETVFENSIASPSAEPFTRITSLGWISAEDAHLLVNGPPAPA